MLSRLGVAGHVVVALQPAHPTEHRVVGAPRSAHEVEQRDGDRDADPREHAEDGNPGEANHRQLELGASREPESLNRVEVDQPENSGDDDRSQRREGQVLEEACGEEQDERKGEGGDKARELCSRAGGLGNGRPGRARRDREALEQSGRRVRRSHRQKLVVLVDALTEPSGVAAREHARVRERDEGDTDRRKSELAEIRDVDVGEGDAGQPRRKDADDGNAALGQVERTDDQRSADHRHEYTGNPRRKTPARQDQSEAAEADHERDPVRIIEARDEVADRGHEARRIAGEAEQLGELARR